MAELPPLFPRSLAARYRFERALGAGAMGAVFLVTDLQLDRPAALKVSALEDTPIARERFLREGRAQGRLAHPSLLEIYDCGVAPEGAYLVTEYLTGTTLAELSEGGGSPPSLAHLRKVASVALEVAAALEVVHDAGLVHRDIKPSNIMVPTDGPARLVDFGLVLAPDLTRLTETKQLVGTVATMAPEVLRGATIAPAADWFGLGASLFLACEGRPWRSWPQALLLLDGGSVPEPEFRVLPRDSGIARAILALTREDPSRRLTGSRGLRNLLSGDPCTPPPARLATRRLPLWLPLAGLALLALGAFALRPPALPPPPTPAAPSASPVSDRELARALDLLGDDLQSLREQTDHPADPATILDGHFPGFAAVDEWRRRRPPSATLDQPLVRGARRIDAGFLELGFPRPFGDVSMGSSPPAVEATTPPPLVADITRGLAHPTPAPAPWAQALTKLEEAERARRSLLRSIKGESDAPPLPRELRVYSTYGLANLNETVQTSQAHPDGRAALVVWMRSGAAAFRQGLQLARAAIQQAPRDMGERMAQVAAAVVDRQEAYGLGEACYFDPWAPPPNKAAEGYLVAMWSRQAAEGRRIAGRVWQPLLERGNRELELVLGETTVGPALRIEAAGLLVANWTRLSLEQDALRALERHLDLLMQIRKTQAIAANAGELCWDQIERDPGFRERFLRALGPRFPRLSKTHRRYPRLADAIEAWQAEAEGR